jgi:hypothetical protein
MRLVLAGIFAIGLAFLWDRWLRFLGLNQRIRVGFWVPVGEEMIKYLVSCLFNLVPPLVYLVFGLGEGLYETYRVKRLDLVLMAAGVVTHLTFGLFFILKTPVVISLVFAIAAHLAWNNLVFDQK